MKKSLICCFTLAVIIAMSGVAAAGDDFGIPSYPDAKSDADTQAVCAAPTLGIMKAREDKAKLTSSKHCYRTNDSLAKVAEFYKKQKGLQGSVTIDDPSAKSASFCLSKTGACNESSVGTSVSISAPWVVPHKGKVNKDLLIVITDRVKK